MRPIPDPSAEGCTQPLARTPMSRGTVIHALQPGLSKPALSTGRKPQAEGIEIPINPIDSDISSKPGLNAAFRSIGLIEIFNQHDGDAPFPGLAHLCCFQPEAGGEQKIGRSFLC